MSTTNQSNSHYNNVIKIIKQIVNKSSEVGDGYIYRGEHECYEKASSGLYRAYTDLGIKSPQAISDVIGEAHEEISKWVNDYGGEAQYRITLSHPSKGAGDANSIREGVLGAIENEMLARIQHYGGKTNLIDFTTDYLIALFFACLGSNDENGRLILLKNRDMPGNYKIKKAPSIIRRAETQKSIFVEPDRGFIELTEENSTIICIQGCLKEEVRNYLKNYHDISPERIYNDLHGFIRLQNTYLPIYEALSQGQHWEDEGDKIGTLERLKDLEERYRRQSEEQKLNDIRKEIEELKKCYEKAIGAYNRALKSTNLEEGKLFEIHHKIGTIYYKKGEYNCAIEKYEEAIKLSSDAPILYYDRGTAYEKRGDDCQIVEDFRCATEDYTKVIQLILIDREDKDRIDYRKLCGAFLKCGEFDKLEEVLKGVVNILEGGRIQVLFSDIKNDASYLGIAPESFSFPDTPETS